MQTAFFALAPIKVDAIDAIRKAIEKSYGCKSPELVRMNVEAVEAARQGLREARVPAASGGGGA